MNPAVDLMNAISALRIKRGRYRTVREGTVVQQPGKPDLLLTWEAVHSFAQERAEAEAEGHL